jgi:4-amino-4-deoxy-L-arabinose transferase-like glycosyltransferase
VLDDPKAYRRDRLLRAIVLIGVCAAAITELLSAAGALRRGPLLALWLAFACGAMLPLARHRRSFHFNRPRFPPLDPIIVLCLAGIAAVLTATFVTAAWSPPNSADAMAYHLPRVIYWAQQESVRFFPTPYLNQIMLQPFAEYCMLHTYLLTGGDAVVNLVQWLASLGCIVGVSSLAQLMGLNGRGQAVAALFCATLPSGVLASSGAKNDYVLALWLVCAIYFAWRMAEGQRPVDVLCFGAAMGLAMLTKATAYLFAPCLVAAVLVARTGKRRSRATAACLGAGLAIALLVNTPMYVRNIQLSGSILGFDSAQGDGVFRWRNETIGWRPTVSNLLRHAAEQAGRRSEVWNQAIYNSVAKAHRALRIDLDDPATTWRGSKFTAPRNANHEADAPNFIHLLLLLAAAGIVAATGGWTPRLYTAGLLAALVAFCAYLKWQPFMARLFLPALVAASPLAGFLVRGRRWAVTATALLCALLLDQAKHPALENWVRPLRGPASVFRRSRDERYFADMSQWGNSAAYRETVRHLAGQPCTAIGIDIANLQLEYPLQALLRAARPEMVFIHTGVANASARFAPPGSASPCAVVCLDCTGDEARLSLYSNAFSRRAVAGRFVIFSGLGSPPAPGHPGFRAF